MASSKGTKVQIIEEDMNETMQLDAIELAVRYIDKYHDANQVAIALKNEFDKKYNVTWHCVVGSKFGTSVRYEDGHFIYFYLGDKAILLYKCG